MEGGEKSHCSASIHTSVNFRPPRWRKLVGLAAVVALMIAVTGCVLTNGTGATGPQVGPDVVRTLFGDLMRQLAQAVLL